MSRAAFLACLLGVAWGISACGSQPSWDIARSLERDGQFAKAAQAYNDYLKKNPQTTLKGQVLLGVARCEEGLGDYPKAAAQYLAVVDSGVGSDDVLRAYLGLGNLYRDHLNDSAKALDAYERALNLYLNQPDIRDAVRMLVDAKLQTANALFTGKDFQDAARVARAILQSYPDSYLATDAKARAQGLVDRVDRSGRIQAADADQMFVVREAEASAAASAEFGAVPAGGTTFVSPNGAFKASIRKQNGTPFLYLASAKDPKPRLVARSTGISGGAWSPQGDAWVFVRNVGGVRRLERLDPKSGRTSELFSARTGALGKAPSFDPSGTKVVFAWANRLWVINSDGTNKTKLRTDAEVDPEAPLVWSSDGTLLRYRCASGKFKGTQRVLELDASVQKP